MTLKEQVKHFRKDYIHRNYSRIIKNFKDYDKISRNKIIDEIKKEYDNPNNIIDICSIEELELLKKVMNKKISYKELRTKHEYEFRNLVDKFLVTATIDDKLFIPEEIEESVKIALKQINEEEKIKADEINDMLVGLLKIYGIMSKEELYKVYSFYNKMEKEYFMNHINNNKYFNFYYYELYEDVIIYEPYYYFEDELIYNINHKKNKEGYIRNPIDVIYLKYNRFDDRKNSIKEFIKEAEKFMFFQEKLYEDIEYYVALDLDRTDLKQRLINIPSLKGKDLSRLVELMDKAMDDMPSAVLGGYTKNEYTMLMNKKNYDKNYDRTYKKIKNSENIIEYKRIRQEVAGIFDDCIMYSAQKQRQNKFLKTIKKNNLIFDFNDSNVIKNFILFHKLDEEESNFDLYIKENVNILSKDYILLSKIQDSYVESLFSIEKLDSKNSLVYLKDMYSNKVYEVTDVALSNGNLDGKTVYIYTSLITVNNYTFSTDYAFMFVGETFPDILNEIKIKSKNIKVVKNELTKRFIVCHNLFKKQKDISFVQRNLE